MLPPQAETLIRLALEEDLAYGDVTAEAVFPSTHTSRAFIEARQDLVVCGVDVAMAVFRRLDPGLRLDPIAVEGSRVEAGHQILGLRGTTRSILAGERTALNFLQRLSGIATASHRYAQRIRELGVSTRIADTRKTTPGWRALEKYAVRVGGCVNHRFSLGEHVMIKDNHIAAAGSIRQAVDLCRARCPHTAKIEVEVNTLAQVWDALSAKAEVIMLDNMEPHEIDDAVAMIKRRAIVEVSGGVTLNTLAEFARPGVDVISIGALTHSAKAADLSLTIEPATA